MIGRREDSDFFFPVLLCFSVGGLVFPIPFSLTSFFVYQKERIKGGGGNNIIVLFLRTVFQFNFNGQQLF